MTTSPNRAETLVFVGGAPRSGTTLAHALLCSAEGVNRFHPEISFFRGLGQAYALGLNTWSKHTHAFFEEPGEFRDLVAQTARMWLDWIWKAVGRTRILCVKDPHLTPLFPALHKILPEARFVTVFRHPFDVVRSRQDVMSKMGQPFGEVEAINVAREYRLYYDSILRHRFGGRHFAFRYEDFESEPMRQALARFMGVPGFDQTRMWSKEAEAEMPEDDPWRSPKYFRPVDLNRRLDPLAPELQAVVQPICEPIMRRMAYSEAGSERAVA